MSNDIVEFLTPADASTFVDTANKTECEKLTTIKTVTASASIAFFFFFIVLTVLLKKWETTAEKLVIVLNVCSLGGSIAYVLASPQPEELRCTIEAWLIQTSDWAQLVCCLCIVFHRYASIKNYKQREQKEIKQNKVRYERIDTAKIGCLTEVKYFFARYINLILFFTFVFSTVPFFDQRYGAKGAWCWITKKESDERKDYILWVMLIWYGWISLALFGFIGVYCKLHRKLKDIPENDDEDKKDKENLEKETKLMFA